MIVEAQVPIDGSKEAIWTVITDIAHAADIMSGIESIEIVDRPPLGLVGLRWRETRILFGKPATVEKGITEAVENEFYTTRAEDGGFVFVATVRVEETAGGMTLTSTHTSLPQRFSARLSTPLLYLFRGVTRKALRQDLNDIKTAVERV